MNKGYYKPITIALRGEELEVYERLHAKGYKSKQVFVAGLKALDGTNPDKNDPVKS